MKHDEELQVAYAGVLGPFNVEDLLFQAQKASRLAPLQVVRADRVVGDAHILSAAMHSMRAIEEGRQQADRPEVEFLRYLAGERQIKKALQKMGVDEDAEAAVVIALGEKAADAVPYFADGLGLRQDDTVIAPSAEKAAAFGITDALLATAPGAHEELVLEAVAAVDLKR